MKLIFPRLTLPRANGVMLRLSRRDTWFYAELTHNGVELATAVHDSVTRANPYIGDNAHIDPAHPFSLVVGKTYFPLTEAEANTVSREFRLAMPAEYVRESMLSHSAAMRGAA